MKKVVLIASILIAGLAASGCQPESTVYQYQAGSQYEYKQLIDAWIPNNDTLPPLPPISEGSEGEWVQVPAAGAESVSLASHHPQPRIYVSTHYGGGRPYRRWRHGPSLWRGRRGYSGSGLSIGFSFGSGPRWPRYGCRDVWNDWFCEWPCGGTHSGRHLGR